MSYPFTLKLESSCQYDHLPSGACQLQVVRVMSILHWTCRFIPTPYYFPDAALTAENINTDYLPAVYVPSTPPPPLSSAVFPVSSLSS